MPKKSTKQTPKQSTNLLKFSRQSSQPQMSVGKDSHQKYITTNTSLGHVLAMISMGICRRITNYELIQKRLITYICLVLIGGLIHDFAPLISRSFVYQIQKTNVLNQWFVKIGWFWTLVLTSPLMTITSMVLKDNEKAIEMNFNTNNNNKKSEKYRHLLSLLRTRQLLRIFFNTCVWFISTNIFVYFEDMTGSCAGQLADPDIATGISLKSICIKSGHKWIPGFDISGHTFLLIYSNLILIEESAVMIGWEPFGHQLFEQIKNKRSEDQIHVEKQWLLYNQYSQPLRVLFVLITLLSMIWDFMLVQTSLFYHTMFQKLVAAVWALTVWALTYGYLYKQIQINVKSPKLNKNS